MEKIPKRLKNLNGVHCLIFSVKKERAGTFRIEKINYGLFSTFGVQKHSGDSDFSVLYFVASIIYGMTWLSMSMFSTVCMQSRTRIHNGQWSRY